LPPAGHDSGGDIIKRFLLYGHGGAYNHGAEAGLSSTIRIIRDKYVEAHVSVVSHFPQQDMEFGIDADQYFTPVPEFWAAEKTSASQDDRERLARRMYQDALNSISSDTVCLSVGGDNFSYPNWHRWAVFQSEAVKKNAKTILWGCSVEPSAVTPGMKRVLETYSHILARESHTLNNLKNTLVDTDVQMIPDPAFLLEPEPVLLPQGFRDGGFVGVNVSPLIVRRESVSGSVLGGIRLLIDRILSDTNANIALIPHVTMPMDNDHSLLSDIEQSIPERFKPRVWLAGEHFSAAELKYIISKCRLLVCSRTHASIAAYSSGVPALVLSYSVKSAGIAEDLGTSEHVINVSDVGAPNTIRDMFLKLESEIDEQREILSRSLERYVAKIGSYAEYI